MLRPRQQNRKLYKLWKDIIEAISGTEQDFTTGSLKRAILLLSVPMVLEMIMESIFAVVDIFFVSKLGAEQVAAVGITESLLTIIYAVGVGLGTATTAIVSRRTGEKYSRGASLAAMQAIISGFIISLFISIGGIIFAGDLLRLMGSSDEVLNTGKAYTSIMLGSNMVIMLLFIINAIFRSTGDAAMSMRVMWIANILNIILDPILIFGLGPVPAMGIKGAAIATSIGRGSAVVYQIYILFNGYSRIHLSKKDIRINFGILRQIFKLSVGGIFQSLIATTSWIGLYRIIAVFGSEALAGYTIAIRILIFSLLPSWGLGNAAATLVGQNLGAKQADRAEKSVWVAGFINMGFLAFFAIIFISNPEYFIQLFIKDADVIRNGAISLRIISYGYLAYAFGMVMLQSFNGAGDTMTPTMINFICFWMIEVPLAYFLALKYGYGEQGVYYSIVIAESILAVFAIILFKQGKWKQKKV